MNKPLIGICTDHVVHFPHPNLDRSYLKLYPSYVHAVLKAGGTPLVIPIVDNVEDIRPLLSLVRGVVMIGSDDYPSEWYGKPTLPTDKPCTPQRAAFDRPFARLLYEETRLPVLAVCGGMQLAGIHSGGALIQDLPNKGVEHRAATDGTRTHGVEVAPGSLLARVTGATALTVNTLHHQAVERTGPRLKATAWAPDGVIEAVEWTDHPFRIGLQWHPERMPEDAAMQKLWRAFVDAARG